MQKSKLITSFVSNTHPNISVKTFKNRTQTPDINADDIKNPNFWVSVEATIQNTDPKYAVFKYSGPPSMRENPGITPCKGIMVISYGNRTYLYNYTLPTVRQSTTDNPPNGGFVMMRLNQPFADISELPDKVWHQFGSTRDIAFRVLFEKIDVDQTIFRDDATTEVFCYRIKKIYIN